MAYPINVENNSCLLCLLYSDRNWFVTVLEEVAVKHFCLPRDDPRLEMASIKEEPTGVSFVFH